MFKKHETHSKNTSEISQNWEKICRSCLTNSGKVNLFSHIFEGNVLLDIYKALSLLELTEDDGLPNKLCEFCTDFVIQFYHFKQRVLNSEHALLNFISKERNPAEENTVRNDFLTTAFIQTHQYESSENHTSIRESIHLVAESSCKKESMFVEIKPESKEDNGIVQLRKSRESGFTCTFCNGNFDNYTDYKIHRQREADLRRKKYPCSVCHKLISTYKLKDHINSHTKECPYQCGICGEKFRFRSSLTRHNFRHNDKKPHECPICGKGFIQAPTLTDHIRTHSGEKSFMCNVCGKSFVTKHALGNHINMHKVCDDDSDTGKYFTCQICKKVYSSKSILKNHMYVHSDKKFLCSECGKKFSTKTLLDCHVKVHSGVKPYVCEVCSKAFSQKNSLQKHNLTHTGEKPVLCIVCGKRFSQKGHLTYHMRKHSGERPYTCTFCEKTFNHTGSLKVHIRIHTGEKPFVCDICSKGFYDSSSMKKHKKIHDEVKSDINLKSEVQ